ncbi:MAG: redoxin family protein [Alphaproteobacteria bacterium]|nr:redoxin family protein [Alphaproteobacteria bacterium]
MRRYIPILVVLAGVAVALGMIWAAQRAVLEREGRPPLDGPMTSFTLEQPAEAAPQVTFATLDGTETGLDAFAGEVLLVNFWATWCGPCVEEMPALDRLAEDFADRPFRVLAVSIDREGASIVRPFLDRHGIDDLTAYLDPAGATPRAFQAIGLPTTVLIDAAGRWVGSYQGDAPWDGPEAKALIAHYLPDAQG